MSKVLARAFVKLALKEDKQIAINTAEAAQGCGVAYCDLSKLNEAESKELKEWADSFNDDQ